MSVTTPARPDQRPGVRTPPQQVAAGAAALIALLYGLTFAGVLTIEGSTSDDRRILGVAAAVFVVLAALLWVRRSRVLWAGAVALQIMMGTMYLAIAPERDPSFEVWGITIRLVSFVLLVALVTLLIGSRPRARDRAEG